MTDVPQSDPHQESAFAVAQRLDPDIALAVTQGNKAVIDAINGGATTVAQVVDVLQRTQNVSELPVGMQVLIKEVNEQRPQQDADPRVLRRVAEAAVFTAATVMGPTSSASADSSSAPPSDRPLPLLGQNFSAMTATERTAYFNSLSMMNEMQWMSMSYDEQSTSIDNLKSHANSNIERLTTGHLLIEDMLEDKRLGADIGERIDASARLQKHFNEWARDNPDKKWADYDEHLSKTQGRNGLTVAEAEYASHYAHNEFEFDRHRKTQRHAEAADERLKEGRIEEAGVETRKAAEATKRPEMAPIEYTLSPSVKASSLRYDPQATDAASLLAGNPGLRGELLEASTSDTYTLAGKPAPSKDYTITASQLAPALAAFTAPEETAAPAAPEVAGTGLRLGAPKPGLSLSMPAPSPSGGMGGM